MRQVRQRLANRIIACSTAVILLLTVFLGGVWGSTPKALGIFSQGFGLDDLDQKLQPVVHYALTYTQGEGFSFQESNETTIRVRVDGASLITQAQMPDLKQILDNACVELGAQDRAVATMTVNGQGGGSLPEIDITRVRTNIINQPESIPYPVKKVDDPYLPPGQTEIRSPGQPGVLLKTYRVTTENDVEVKRQEIGSQVVKQPVPRLIACGIQTDAGERKASRGNGGKTLRTIQVVATAYTRTGDRTATGVWPYVGGVAVDPNVIPLGSKLYIDGYGPARAVDTGGLIKGNRIDLYFDSEAECLAWGRRVVEVDIME
jgi:3D (Asp-Asp-Asp) domain-containing protein